VTYPTHSVRIHSKKTFDSGLFIADIYAMPIGCSVWPAWWSVGPNWPEGGEIDVIEGVNNQIVNQYTLHTSEGCTLNNTIGKTFVSTTAQVVNTRCAVSGADNTGCAFLDTDTRSYGQGFNNIGGGIFAHLWDSTGIRAWHFPRSEIPADIDAKKPNPDNWGPPAAFFSGGTCDMQHHFFDHTLIFDTTLCGDWAGSVYQFSGCPGTCAQAVANPANFVGALVYLLSSRTFDRFHSRCQMENQLRRRVPIERLELCNTTPPLVFTTFAVAFSPLHSFVLHLHFSTCVS
jgi:hypothetical protein